MLPRRPVLFPRAGWLLALVLLLALVVPTVSADDFSNTQGFRKQVTLEGVREHQAAFQAIADANGGNRAAGLAGYDASAQYVRERMAAMGYDVTVQEFQFLFVGDRTPPVLEMTSPAPRSYVEGVDFATMSYSGSGNVTASITPVDTGGLTSGCEAADFAGFPAGNIALIRRGTCTFNIKATNALNAGATGAIIFNTGISSETMGVINGTLTTLVNLPVVGTTFAVGMELLQTSGAVVHLQTDVLAETLTTRNIIAESPLGDPSRVVVAGAHLDSVFRGPGINDNGSGSAALLEVAEVYAQQERSPRNKLRFIWFGAEEFVLLGSEYYVDNLSQDDRDKILLMLNFDMVGSPNFVRFVYDGDNSAFPVGPGAQAGPAGSGAIEAVFANYFASQGLATEPTPFSGRSDYGPFIEVGIPAGGLFTGAEGIKTAAEASTYGGTAGQAYDPCYHLACDTFANNNNTALDQMTDAIAHTVLYFAKYKGPLEDPAVIAARAGARASVLRDEAAKK